MIFVRQHDYKAESGNELLSNCKQTSPKFTVAITISRAKMSETTTVVDSSERKTVTLQNGTVFSFDSNTSTTLEKIPIVDASGIWSDRLEDRLAVAEQIREASRNIGFFYLINHVCTNQATNIEQVLTFHARGSTRNSQSKPWTRQNASLLCLKNARWRCSPASSPMSTWAITQWNATIETAGSIKVRYKSPPPESLHAFMASNSRSQI